MIGAFVVQLANRLLLHFLDRNDKHAVMTFNIAPTEVDPTGGAASAIADAAAAMSDSALYETEIQIVAVNNATPTYGTTSYSSPADKAAFTFRCADDGTRPKIQIGAPKDMLFSDAWDINKAQTQVAAFILAMGGNAVSEGGSPITSYATGTRRMPARLKKH